MIYKSKLSTTGRNLLTKIYENNNYYTKPKKNCIKKILHNLFTSNYDLEIEKIANDMYTSSQKIYENIFNSYLIKKYNRTAIYNIIIATTRSNNLNNITLIFYYFNFSEKPYNNIICFNPTHNLKL